MGHPDRWRFPWNSTFLGMRWSNWAMIAAGIAATVLVFWIDPP